MNSWVIILIAVWTCGAIACAFSNSPKPFNDACGISLFIGLAYLLTHMGN